MDRDTFTSWLSAQRGVVRFEEATDELMFTMYRDESSVTSMMGTPTVCTGLKDCIHRNGRFILFLDSGFWVPDISVMKLVNREGEIVGRTITKDELEEYSSRDDVVVISDCFVFHLDVHMGEGSYMEMLSQPYAGENGFLEGTNAVLWFPCTTCSDMLHTFYHQPLERLGTAIIALDLDP